MDRVIGLLLGTAIGDSLGLPREGLRRDRAARIYRGPLRQRLLLGRGMLSDDTEHACMTAQALLVAGDDPRRFARVLAGELRWWLLGLPAAVGGAANLPARWLEIADWPRSVSWIRMLGSRVATRGAPLRLWWPTIAVRNAVFTAIVFATAVRRLLPPYGRLT